MMGKCLGSLLVCLGIAFLLTTGFEAQSPMAARTDGKYQLVAGWAQLPQGVKWGPVAAVATDPKGTIHAFRRQEPAIFTLDANGKFVKSWGEGIFKWTHGLRVDRNGFIWATDGQGHQVMKFSPDGKLLLTLGKRDVPGDGPDSFNRPTDVVVAPNGDFYVSDGYGNSRVAKFSNDGKFIKAWGRKGTAPGEFNLPHTIVMDSAGRVFVGDRENKRIQIFDGDGKFLDQWTQLGSPYGMFMTRDDVLYVADGALNKLTIANARDGKMIDVIEGLTQPHWVSVDSKGNIYVAEVRGESVKKFAKK